MDTSASAKSYKLQNMVEGQRNNENEDRISNLPGHILHYILSFLPTKYAVGTSVLSTRWKYLWTWIHNLDFNDQQLYSSARLGKNYFITTWDFLNFVDRVLLVNDVSNLQKFSLVCRKCAAAYFNEWISIVISRNVQELILCITNIDFYMFPSSFFTCDTLKILKIDMEVLIHTPSSICFSSLKILHLVHISFCGEQWMQEVSLSCPILEELLMDDCVWLEIKTVNISAPTLERLTIYERWNESGGFNGCDILIYADRVISLKLRCFLSYTYSMHKLSSLVNASIAVTSSDDSVHCVGTLLKEISNVKDLELSSDSLETLCHRDISAHMLPFSRLTTLSMVSSTGPAPVGFRLLVELLCNMPNLESLSFPDGLDSFTCKGQSRIVGRTPLPQCFLSRLKLVHFFVFLGKENELWFVRFLMKSARVTSTLTIKVGRHKYIWGYSAKKLKEKIAKQMKKLDIYRGFVVDFLFEDDQVLEL